MQNVYKDGSGGAIEPLDFKKMEKALHNKNIDRVEVFNLDSPAHNKAVSRIKNLSISRREKKRLKRLIDTNKEQ